MRRTLKDTTLRFRRAPIVVIQLALIGLSYWLAFQLRFDSRPPDWASAALQHTLPWLILIRGLTFLPFRLYEGLWKYTGLYDLEALIGGVLVSSGLFTIFLLSPFGAHSFPRSVIVIDALLVTMMLGGMRMARRVLADFTGVRTASSRRVLVYGAGDAGQMIVREMRNKRSFGSAPVGFVDDDPAKIGRRIHRVKVYGGRADIADIIDRTDPTEILLALPGLDPAELRRIVESLEAFHLPIKTLPNLRDIIDGKVGVEQIRTLRVEDLLSRPAVGLNSDAIRALVHGRRVLVTGAGGSIGSELCRQILSFRPSSLVLFERYENSLHAIRLELEDVLKKIHWRDRPASVGIYAVVGDVTDAALVTSAFTKHRPELVFHAAAHKHVPLMEENPCEAVKNNVRGTRVLAAAAEEAGVDRFILISTDKAANPVSVMGASKRLAELVVQQQAEGSGTSFAIVRFGNVLGSNGSVVPRFIEQIRTGGPVTVTHPDVRRFFMLIPEAVQLVLHAAADAKAGDTYVLDMGEQVKLVDVARNMIRLAGRIPDEEIAIEFIGLRPGEKLEEELYGAGELLRPSAIPKVMVVNGRPKATPEFLPAVTRLEDLAFTGAAERVVAELRMLVGAPIHTDGAEFVAPAMTPAGEREQNSRSARRQECPACGYEVHRSKAKRIDQHIRKRFTTKRLYRCSRCGWCDWVFPMDRPVNVSVDEQSAPDLAALDQLPASNIPEPRRHFSPKSLQ